jgi:putative transposase
MVTASTYLREPLFGSRKRLRMLTSLLLEQAVAFSWALEAWAVFANHYHFIGRAPEAGAENLSRFLATVHRRSATWLNRLEGMPGRKVWHNYRETSLTFETSYLARLHYVMTNPVKHGLVTVASQYPWCSAGWFEKHATSAFRKSLETFPIDRLNVEDDF